MARAPTNEIDLLLLGAAVCTHVSVTVFILLVITHQADVARVSCVLAKLYVSQFMSDLTAEERLAFVQLVDVGSVR